MKKNNINYYYNKIKHRLYVGQISTIYLLNDGRILKIFNKGIIPFFKQIGYDLEEKIVSSSKYQIISKIKRPLEALYVNGIFCGYIMERAKGITFNELECRLTIKDRVDLYKYAIIHSNLEQIVKDSKEIVFPDLLTCDNIFVDDNLNIELIDFDGFQVGSNPAIGISTSLGNQEKLLSSSKYYNPNTKLFSKQLDIKSLIHLYFLDVFNVDLNKVGEFNPFNNRMVTLDYLFESIGLDNYDIMNKIWKIFQEKHQNEYLGESLFEIAENYTMIAIQNSICKDVYIKKLKRK